MNRRTQRRINELERLIEIYKNSLAHSQEESDFYYMYEMRLHQLKSEYKDKTGREYDTEK